MSTHIETLTIRVAAKLSIDDQAARAALETYILELEVMKGRTIDPDEISDDDAAFLTGTVAAAQKAGDLGDRELEALQEKVDALADAAAAVQLATEDRDRAIVAALAAGARPADVAATAGVSGARVRQIRAGTR